MQHHNNHVVLVGRLDGEPDMITNTHGETFFDGILKVQRQSGTSDLLPIFVPTAMVGEGAPLTGRHLRLEGVMRSYNKLLGGKHCLFTSLLVRSITDADQAEDDNLVTLEGVICKAPSFRETPFGREICDFILAINHGRRSSYIPCIAWGQSARNVSVLEVGTTVELEGRYQSREYQKVLNSGEMVTRTTREVSCRWVRAKEAEA